MILLDIEDRGGEGVYAVVLRGGEVRRMGKKGGHVILGHWSPLESST